MNASAMPNSNLSVLRDQFTLEQTTTMICFEYPDFLHRCPLLSLPAELRRLVFRHLFSDGILVARDRLGTAGYSWITSIPHSDLCREKRELTRAILQTCRQLREEGSSIFYQVVVLELQSLGGVLLTVSTLGMAIMHLITNLYLPVINIRDLKDSRISSFFGNLRFSFSSATPS